MPDLYIHVGTHKTGSSVIQGALKRYSADLEREGILYVPAYSSFKELKLAQARSYSSSLVDKIRKKVDQSITSKIGSSYEKFILSFEPLCGLPKMGYSNADVIAEMVHQAFVNINTEIIIYLRRQDEFIESMYTQKVKEGESYTFNQFLGQTAICNIDWYALVDAYGSRFGAENVNVCRYHRQFLPNSYSIIQTFGEIIDSKKLSECNTSSTSNVGYTRTELEIARRTNTYLNNEEQSELRNILENTKSKEYSERYSFFVPDERRALLQKHASSNRRIADEYLSEDVSFLFPKPNFEEYKEWEGLSVDRTAVTLTLAMVALNEDTQNQTPYILHILQKIERKLIGKLNKYPRAKRAIKSILHRLRLI